MELFDVFVLIIIIMIVGFIVISQQELTKKQVRQRIIQMFQEEWTKAGWTFHATDDIIQALRANKLPDRLMITTHPQRWNNMGISWIKELLLQNIKNIVKRIIVRNKHKNN